MMDFDPTDPEEVDRTHAKARLESKRIQELFKEVFGSDEGKEALQILRAYFMADVPSAPAANFEPNQAFYMDGHKAVFKEITDIMEGKYNEN